MRQKPTILKRWNPSFVIGNFTLLISMASFIPSFSLALTRFSSAPQHIRCSDHTQSFAAPFSTMSIQPLRMTIPVVRPFRLRLFSQRRRHSLPASRTDPALASQMGVMEPPSRSGRFSLETSPFCPPAAPRYRIVEDHPDVLTQAGAHTLATFFVLGLSGLFASLIYFSGPGSWRYYLAGGVCASASHAVTTPIDVIKTRQQVQYADTTEEGCDVVKKESILKATMSVLREDGPSALLAGLGPTTLGYLLEGAVKFGVYEVLKLPLTRLLSNMLSIRSTMLSFALAATISGVAASFLLCPMEALRIRLVAEPELAKSRKGWIDAGMKILEHEGPTGLLFGGTTAMMAKQIPYTVTKQVSFDRITAALYAATRRHSGFFLISNKGPAIALAIPFLSAAITSAMSCVASQPGDMLLSAVNAHEGRGGRTRDFARDIVRRDGIKGLFVGMEARFLHVGLIVTVQLLIYDMVKRMCGIPATGSV